MISSIYQQMWNEKRAALTTFFLLTIVVYSPSCSFMKQIFFYKGGHSIAHSIFKTCLDFFKRMKPAYILNIKYTVNFAWKISLIASDGLV